MIKTIINTFWQSTIFNGKSFLSSNYYKKIERANFLVNIFYFFTLITSIQTFSSFYQFPEWNTILNSKDLFIPIWSLQWISPNNWEVSVRLILLSYLFFSLLGFVLWKRYTLVRIFVFISIFLYLSLISSFGKIDHYMHLMVLISFLLIFIPTKVSNHNSQKDVLKIFFGIQTLILLSYFVSGIFKLYGILDQEISGLTSSLSEESLALNMSKTILGTNTDYFLSSLILKNPSSISSIILNIGYLIEFFSVYVIFKPKLHRIWGLLLILLHTGILLSVGPDFTIQVFLVGIFLLFSPFNISEFDLTKDISIIWKSTKNRFKKPKKKNEFIIFYDGDCSMCNNFLSFISRYNLPEEMKISKLKGKSFNQIIQGKLDLNEIDSIVIVEINEDKEKIVRIKANGVLWVLSRITKKFLIINLAYKISPFIGNFIYDLVAKNRKKIEKNNCPIPPKNISIRIID